MNPWDKVDIEFQEYAIGGKMITAKVVVSEMDMMYFLKDDDSRQMMRHKLVSTIASEMLDKQLCEINQIKNPIDLTTTLVARAYVAPDATIKILRSLK